MGSSCHPAAHDQIRILDRYRKNCVHVSASPCDVASFLWIPSSPPYLESHSNSHPKCLSHHHRRQIGRPRACHSYRLSCHHSSFLLESSSVPPSPSSFSRASFACARQPRVGESSLLGSRERPHQESEDVVSIVSRNKFN